MQIFKCLVSADLRYFMYNYSTRIVRACFSTTVLLKKIATLSYLSYCNNNGKVLLLLARYPLMHFNSGVFQHEDLSQRHFHIHNGVKVLLLYHFILVWWWDPAVLSLCECVWWQQRDVSVASDDVLGDLMQELQGGAKSSTPILPKAGKAGAASRSVPLSQSY